MIYTDKIFEFVKAWEGFHPQVRVDPLNPNVKDIGFGHVLLPGENFTIITLAEGNHILRMDLSKVSVGVTSLVHVPLSQQRFDALVSFALNVGLDIDEDDKAEGLGDSTLLKYVNAAELDKAALQFTLWVHASGKKEWGLAKRRFAEQAIFSFGNYTWLP